MRSLPGRLAASVGVLAVAAVAVACLLAPWLLDGGSNVGDPGHGPDGLRAIPAELWVVLVAVTAIWLVTGLAHVWRRRAG